MTELRAPLLKIRDKFPGLGHEYEHGIVLHPWTALVSLLKTSDLLMGPTVFPSVIAIPGLWGPEMLGERHARGGIGVSVAQLKIGIRPDPGVDELCVILSVGGEGKDRQKKKYKDE